MSSATSPTATAPAGAPGRLPAPGTLALWERQLAAVLAYELPRILLSGRAITLYVVAALPVLPITLVAFLSREPFDLASIHDHFAILFQFLLRFILYFGCVGVFSNLFRVEILERSLHYYFLMPIRREVVAAGKYLAGTLAAMALFCTSTLLAYLALHVGHSPKVVLQQMLVSAGGTGIVDYVATAALACLAYGAVFLLAGLYFKNPMIPAVLFWGWEQINFLLPPLLKKLSVVYYLQSLSPLPAQEGPFALLAEPVSPPAAIIGLVVLSAAVLAAAGRKVRRMEVAYGAE